VLTQKVQSSQHTNGIKISYGAEGIFDRFAGNKAASSLTRKTEARD